MRAVGEVEAPALAVHPALAADRLAVLRAFHGHVPDALPQALLVLVAVPPVPGVRAGGGHRRGRAPIFGWGKRARCGERERQHREDRKSGHSEFRQVLELALRGACPCPPPQRVGRGWKGELKGCGMSLKKPEGSGRVRNVPATSRQRAMVERSVSASGSDCPSEGSPRPVSARSVAAGKRGLKRGAGLGWCA